ncbi:MAG: hypothetical protein H0X39_00175 [Actinobacteria bacterium]|nr:hypothetical protein [Actinomycetota bacterium]
MSETPKYLELLQRHRAKDARTWPEIAVAAGVKARTSEPWIKGNVAEPPLVGIVRLAVELGVTPRDLFDAVMGDEAAGRIGLLDEILERVEKLEATLNGAALRQLLSDAERATAAIGDRRDREAGSEPAG